MPAARKRSRSFSASKMRSSAMAVCTMQSGCSARSASVSLVPVTPVVWPRPARSPASLPDLVGIRHIEPDQLELGMGIDAGQGVATDVAGTPLHDAVRHGVCSLEVGEGEFEVGRLQATVDLNDLARDVGAGG